MDTTSASLQPPNINTHQSLINRAILLIFKDKLYQQLWINL